MPRLPAVLAAGLLLTLGHASTASAAETVTTAFDLSGWYERGVVTMGSDTFDSMSLRRLMDGSDSTGIRGTIDGPVLVSVDFQTPQRVDEVELVPGPLGSYAAELTIVRANGSSTSLDERVVSGGGRASWRLPTTRVRSMEFRVEGLDRTASIDLRELRVVGEVTVDALELQNVPERLPEGGSFRPRIIGRDSLGGAPDLSDIARLSVVPERALENRGDGRYRARLSVVIGVSPRLGSLTGNALDVIVQPRGPAPPEPIIRPGFEVVQLEAQGDPPMQVIRRQPGVKQPRSLGVTWSGRFVDQDVEQGQRYSYSVVSVDRFGNATTDFSPEVSHRVPRRIPRDLTSPGRCPVLVVLYVDSFDRNGVTGEGERIVESLEAARLFLYRHTRGAMALDVSYLAMEGPTPPTTGPSMAGIERDLRDLGVPDDAFAAVFAVSNDLEGAHGGFRILGRSGGAMGRGPGVATPPGALGPDPDVAWVFVHELRHVVASTMGPSAGFDAMASGDFAQDFAFGPLGAFRGRPLDIGDAWDGQAVLASDARFWARLEPPFRQPLEIIDSDGDGLADADARLPLDEARFGSDPLRADTDGDGLDDMAEAAAGLYGGCDPNHPDTDRDGVPDGEDPWPLSDFTGVIPRGDEPVHLAQGPIVDRPTVALAACWSEQALTLRVTTPWEANVYVDLDGSGALGRWESDVDIGKPGQSASDVWAGPARIALRAHAPPTGVFLGGERVPGATVLARPLEDGGVQLEARLPSLLGPGAEDATVSPYAERATGLRLTEGTVLGLAVTVRQARPTDPAPWQAFTPDGRWVSLFETHRLMDAVLVAGEGD